MMERGINFSEQVARQKLAPLPESFEFSGWEIVGPDTVVYRGGVARKISRGERKGQLTWDKITHKVAVTKAETKAAEMKYEADTGNCYKCCGNGEMWAGWNCETGNKFKTCTRCGGSGKKFIKGE